MSFGFFRTIWISIRATNYTTRAFQDTIRGLKKMEQEQIKFQLRAKRNMLSLGALYLAFGGIAVRVISGVLSASTRGQKVLDNFSSRAGKSLERLSNAFANVLEPILKVLASILEFVTANPILNHLTALAVVFGTTLLFVSGATKILNGAIGILTIMMGKNAVATTASSQTLLTQWTTAATVATPPTLTLAAAVQAVFAGFAIGFSIVSTVATLFGKIPAIIAAVTVAIVALAIALWSAAGGLSVLTFGAAAVAGGAAIAGAIAASSPDDDFGVFQMGTSYVRRTGPALVHEGEEIISARENRMPARMDRAGVSGGSFPVTKNAITVNINGNVNTKASTEELAPAISRAIRKELGNKV